MRKIDSQADVITDLEDLIEAIDRTPVLEQALEVEQEALAEALAEIQGHKASQLEYTGLRQEATRLLHLALAKARDLTIVVRSIVRGKVGPRSQILAQFKVPVLPIRRRTPPVTQPEEPEEPPEGGTVEVAEEVQEAAPSTPSGQKTVA